MLGGLFCRVLSSSHCCALCDGRCCCASRCCQARCRLPMLACKFLRRHTPAPLTHAKQSAYKLCHHHVLGHVRGRRPVAVPQQTAQRRCALGPRTAAQQRTQLGRQPPGRRDRGRCAAAVEPQQRQRTLQQRALQNGVVGACNGGVGVSVRCVSRFTVIRCVPSTASGGPQCTSRSQTRLPLSPTAKSVPHSWNQILGATTQ